MEPHLSSLRPASMSQTHILSRCLLLMHLEALELKVSPVACFLQALLCSCLDGNILLWST
jgi:hypothetical protein